MHTFSLTSSGAWKAERLTDSVGPPFRPGLERRQGAAFHWWHCGVTSNGRTLVVANVYNDSISLIDLAMRKVSAELDLRPGKVHRSPDHPGIPGGEYPFWVAVKGDSVACVSSIRDREIVVVGLGRSPAIQHRIHLAGNPNKMILNRDQSRLFVTADNTGYGYYHRH